MPTRDDVKKVKSLIHSEVEWQFFFDNVKSAEWIDPLCQEGIFNKPEDIKKIDGIIRVPTWPPGKYLIRVAAEKSKKVAEIIKNIPETENPNVLEACLEAMIEMPV